MNQIPTFIHSPFVEGLNWMLISSPFLNLKKEKKGSDHVQDLLLEVRLNAYWVITVKFCRGKRYSESCFQTYFYDHASITPVKLHVYLHRTEEFIRKGVFKTWTNNLELITCLTSIKPKSILIGFKAKNMFQVLKLTLSSTMERFTPKKLINAPGPKIYGILQLAHILTQIKSTNLLKIPFGGFKFKGNIGS